MAFLQLLPFYKTSHFLGSIFESLKCNKNPFPDTKFLPDKTKNDASKLYCLASSIQK